MGFHNVISKPVRPKDFLEAVSDLLSCTEDEKLNFHKGPEILDKAVFNQLSKFNPTNTLRSLYIDFIEEFDQQIKLIEEAFGIKETQSLIENFHTIKGNSGTFGAKAIFILSSHADLQARAEDWESLEITIKNLKNERVIFKKYLEEETIFKS